jgi:thiamine-phosphate pyrophosphorylase
MKFNLISYPVFYKGEVEVVIRLLQTYDFTFHLRKPNASAYEYDALLQSIPEYLHPKIIIHNAYELTRRYNLKGIHFSEKYRGPMSRLETTIIKSTSCHTINELCEIENYYQNSFLSPVFKDASNPVDYPGLHIEDVKEYLSTKRKLKIIALGGISEHNIHKISEMKFDGVAVLGPVWDNDPSNISMVLNNFKRIYNCYSTNFHR